MERSQEGRLPPPPGLFRSLQAGFDSIASHIYLILLPLGLDLLLWLGPHMNIEELFRPILRATIAALSQGGISSSDLSLVQSGLQTFSHGFNMVSLLHTLPIGVPSLNYSRNLLLTPYAAAWLLDINSPLTFLLAWAGLTAAGWILGSLFYHWIADVTAPQPQHGGLPRTAKAVLNGFLLCALWALLLMIISFPIALILVVLGAITPGLAQAALLLGFFAFMWVLPLIFFSGHGIFAYGQNLFQSLGTAFRMVRFTLPTTALFILCALLISEGLMFLWRVPPADSWLTLVGIAGHAFVTTALLAASFVYFRSVNAWLQILFERAKLRQRSISA
jgi:hypothetical protein